MKVAVLMRYPRVERAAWKRALIEGLLERGYDVALVFGERSYAQHARAALKQYGLGAVKKRGEVAARPEPRLLGHFRDRGVPVVQVGDLNGEAGVRALRALAPDLLLLLGTGIIRKGVLDVPRVGTVHCHQGYLPTYRGVNTIEWALYHGDDVHITAHFVDPGIDTGRILQRERVALLPGDDVARVRERCQQAAVPLLLRTIDAIRDGTAEPIPQAAHEGRQYFAMHPFFVDQVNRLLRERYPAGGPANGHANAPANGQGNGLADGLADGQIDVRANGRH